MKTKVKVIASDSTALFEESINKFIEDKKVIDIRYQTFIYSTRYDKNGNPMENRLNERALILYEEDAK